MPKHIVILSTLDTKGEEAKYLKDLIEAQGFKILLMDTSIGGEPTLSPDISSEEVARLEVEHPGDTGIQKHGTSHSHHDQGSRIKVQELLGKGRFGWNHRVRRRIQYDFGNHCHESPSLRHPQAHGLEHGLHARLRSQVHRHKGHHHDAFRGGHLRHQ